MAKRNMEKGSSSGNKKPMEESFMKLALPSNGEEVKPHFFKIISSPALELREIRIPPAFTEENGSTLSSYAYLRAPKGKEHRVSLFKKDGNLWFKNGWSSFCESYDLAYGHFLVFRYQGNSRFNVFIFDMSSLEIDYPDLDTSSDDGDEDEDWVEGDEDEDEDEEEEEEEESYGEESEDEDTEEEIPYGNSTPMDAGDDPLDKAQAFKCDNPHFIVPMHPSSFIEYRMWIPQLHAKRYLKNVVDDETAIELHVDGGGSWNVKLSRAKRGYLRLSMHGWKNFSMENELKVGDAIVFELVDKEALVYKVHIFRS